MTILRAYVDDSASDCGDESLFMAGYLSTEQNWSQFQQAWKAELRAARPVGHMRMVEANSLRGPFSDWTEDERNQKVRSLSSIINHFAPFSFEVAVSRRSFRQFVQPNAPRGLANPHFACCFGVVAGVSRYAASQGWTSPIEFVFDQQDGVASDFQLFFDYMVKNLPAEARKLISAAPIFGDDKVFLPLQAADMLAWHLRRNYESPSCPVGAAADSLKGPNGHLVTRLEEPILQSWGAHFAGLKGTKEMRTKSQWRNLKREIVRVTDLGYIPPHGSRWKNALYRIKDFVFRR